MLKENNLNVETVQIFRKKSNKNLPRILIQIQTHDSKNCFMHSSKLFFYRTCKRVKCNPTLPGPNMLNY